MQINLLHKVLSFVLNHKLIDLNKKYFDSRILQDKLLCIYHKFTIKVSMPQIINTKNPTKTICLSRVSVQYIFKNLL